ncbi:MAG: chromosomal replication initiator protein DnaA [Spirochaetes bacterium]|nr:chromosomal replication initiator protein DnaA [Spirochaetota bacterium]
MANVDYEVFWNEAMARLHADLGAEEFDLWFSGLNFLRSGENSVVIGVASAFVRDKIKSRYLGKIKARLKEAAGKDIALEFEVVAGAPVENNSPKQEAKAVKTSESRPVVEAEPPKPVKKSKHPQMRDDYTFEHYVIGENNEFAANAAIAISKNPGRVYNPFLIYGSVGLGKTHLMQAIGNSVYENSDCKVIYSTSEDFLNEYLRGIKEGTMTAFKNKFRHTDVLLIDDIQFFHSKDGVQEELFHTFNSLTNDKKHLVLTCDRPPSELKKFSERLLSRFEMSLKVDLQPPRYEVRCAILKATAENRNVAVPDDVIYLISKNISSNVRDLISALNTLIAYSELMGKPITYEIAQQRLRDTFSAPQQANLSVENIIRVVAEHYGLSPNDLKGKKRPQSIVLPRQIAMYIAREITDYSTTELGQEFGGRDHTTVMHSVEKIKVKLLTEPSLDSTIETLKRSVKDFTSR